MQLDASGFGPLTRSAGAGAGKGTKRPAESLPLGAVESASKKQKT
jgi:hypothetical protein